MCLHSPGILITSMRSKEETIAGASQVTPGICNKEARMGFLLSSIEGAFKNLLAWAR